MPGFKKILFATDFSDCAAHAQVYATAFAKRFGAELHIVHAVDTAYPSYAGVYGFGVEVEQHIDAVKKQAREDLAAVGGAASKSGVTVHTHLLLGRPAEAIVDEAVTLGCGLIVTGTHGRSGFDHFLFGSNAERIVRFSQIPVLAVKPREREFVTQAGTFTIKRVLCPCDLSPLADQAAELAAEICRLFGAELTLLHVIDSRLEYPLVAPDPAVFAPEHMRKHALEKLNGLAAKFKDVKTQTEVITGIPDKLIAEAARDRSADLIALTTHGRGGLSRALLGSTAEKLVRKATVPTLTVRPK
jgi:nucleotide-binding universal stress UspA family protein